MYIPSKFPDIWKHCSVPYYVREKALMIIVLKNKKLGEPNFSKVEEMGTTSK